MNTSPRTLLCLVSVLFVSAIGSVSADTDSWGIWRSAENSDPKIEIILKRKEKQLKVNGKLLPTEYVFTNGKQSHYLIEFGNVKQYPDGSETHVGVYLIRGSLDNKPILIGFYYHIEYDSEGRGKKDILKPITLKFVKAFGWKD